MKTILFWITFGAVACLAGLFIQIAASVARGEIKYILIFGIPGLAWIAWDAWKKR